MARASLGVARLLLLFCAGLAYGAEPWMVGAPTFPCDLLFVKGKKVAGTTVGGIVRRMGETFGISFFSPEVPRTKAQAWRSGGREKWILEQFDDFASKASAKKIGWAQEQTLSPRRAGLRNTSQALERLAQRALRLTVVREPMEHALSACTHFGPRVSSGGPAIYGRGVLHAAAPNAVVAGAATRPRPTRRKFRNRRRPTVRGGAWRRLRVRRPRWTGSRSRWASRKCGGSSPRRPTLRLTTAHRKR
ncbi:hypothetical protein M885DRAFT_221476 [Pelagophyceae sp. CCMP2097]|nr:hypothetical protein M885DRAFT_221476 [Pelagophyceae sp. CCMP2097]